MAEGRSTGVQQGRKPWTPVRFRAWIALNSRWGEEKREMLEMADDWEAVTERAVSPEPREADPLAYAREANEREIKTARARLAKEQTHLREAGWTLVRPVGIDDGARWSHPDWGEVTHREALRLAEPREGEQRCDCLYDDRGRIGWLAGEPCPVHPNDWNRGWTKGDDGEWRDHIYPEPQEAERAGEGVASEPQRVHAKGSADSLLLRTDAPSPAGSVASVLRRTASRLRDPEHRWSVDPAVTLEHLAEELEGREDG